MENFTSNILFSFKFEIGLHTIVFGPTNNQSDRAKAFSFLFKHLVKLLSFVRNDSKPAYHSSGTAMLYQNARAVPRPCANVRHSASIPPTPLEAIEYRSTSYPSSSGNLALHLMRA
jgi:hypothetical protein